MSRPPPTIDMLPDGTFKPAPQGFRLPLSTKLGLGAALVVVLGASLAVAAVAIYVVSMILPVLILAGAVAWGAFRYRRWQLRRGQAAYPVQTRGFRQ